MPYGLAVGCVQCHDVSDRVAGEGQSRVRRENPGAGASLAYLMAPANLACLIIDGSDDTSAPETVIRACPSISAVRWLGEVDAVAGMGVHDKQACLRVKTGRAIVGESCFVGCDETSVGCGLFRWIWNRTALVVYS